MFKLFRRIAPNDVQVSDSETPIVAQLPFDPALKDADLTGWCRPETGELLEGFPIRRTDNVLDIGCGGGAYSLFCAQQGAFVTCADIEATALEGIRERFESAGIDRYRTLETDANPLELDDSSQDKVVAMEVLEHVDDPAVFMRELTRVGKPGALYLITVPAELGENIQRELAPPPYFEKPNHVRIFNDDSFTRLVEDSGLVIESKRSCGFYDVVWWALFWTCDQDLAPPWHPLLQSWTTLWGMILNSRDGIRIKRALDNAMPKSQIIVARKP
ncbi:class I SAM-dependent methyltransferase [Gilvimarinus sp. F26214L]|uniref:class I SAM-dependent methyltransferase n=1 Tax=Gilvimarinus sp. DZF01 TaxID=3461371 RepID=UPI0040466448